MNISLNGNKKGNEEKKVPVVLLYFLVFSFYIFPKFTAVEQRKPFDRQQHEKTQFWRRP